MDGLRKFVKRVFDTVVKRPVQNYNVEERAFKAISVAKKDAAPKHLTTQQKIEKYIAEHPELKQITVEKPKTVLDWLKKVRVTSQGLPDTELIKTDKSKLPKRPATYEMPHMFGEIEPKVVPQGKITLQRTTNLVLDYSSKKVKPSAKEIADQYNLDEKDAANLVRHFKAFELYKPAASTGDYSGLPPWSGAALREPGGLESLADFEIPRLESSQSKEVATTDPIQDKVDNSSSSKVNPRGKP